MHLFCNELKKVCFKNEPCYLCDKLSEEKRKVIAKYGDTVDMSKWTIEKDEEFNCYVLHYPVCVWRRE